MKLTIDGTPEEINDFLQGGKPTTAPVESPRLESTSIDGDADKVVKSIEDGYEDWLKKHNQPLMV